MENYKDPKYYENRESVNPKHDSILGTPVNEKYSALIYAKIDELEKIHEGGYYTKRGIYKLQIETEDGEIDFFVKREAWREDLYPEEIKNINIETIQKFYIAKKNNLATFKHMFIYKGKYIVTSLLNNHDKLVLAMNESGENLALVDSEGKLIDKEDYIGRLKIRNISIFVEDIFNFIISSYAKGLYLGEDSLWYLVNKQAVMTSEETSPDFLIGDYDEVLEVDNSKRQISINEAMFYAKINLIEFMEYFCDQEYVRRYIEVVQKKYHVMRNKENNN